MFGIIKKPENNVLENLSNDSNFDNNKQLSDLTNLDNLSKGNNPIWETNLDWLDNISWSKILISDSENLRQNGLLNRQKDTLMVVLIRRLEYFPGIQTIKQIQGLFDAEIGKLEATKDAIKAPTSSDQNIENEATQNPILTQASLEVESELKKILIEKESFDRKLESEVEILRDLCKTIAGQTDNLGKEKLFALLNLYDFEYTLETNVLKIKFEKTESNESQPVKIRIYSEPSNTSTPKFNL